MSNEQNRHPRKFLFLVYFREYTWTVPDWGIFFWELEHAEEFYAEEISKKIYMENKNYTLDMVAVPLWMLPRQSLVKIWKEGMLDVDQIPDIYVFKGGPANKFIYYVKEIWVVNDVCHRTYRVFWEQRAATSYHIARLKANNYGQADRVVVLRQVQKKLFSSAFLIKLKRSGTLYHSELNNFIQVIEAKDTTPVNAPNATNLLGDGSYYDK